MSLIGKDSFTITANGIPMPIPVNNVQWNGNSFSTTGKVMGQGFTATGTATGGNTWAGEIYTSLFRLAPVLHSRYSSSHSSFNCSQSLRCHPAYPLQGLDWHCNFVNVDATASASRFHSKPSHCHKLVPARRLRLLPFMQLMNCKARACCES
jgi:hypothetical protein